MQIQKLDEAVQTSIHDFLKRLASYIQVGEEGRMSCEFMMGPKDKELTEKYRVIIKELISDLHSKNLIKMKGEEYDADVLKILKRVNFCGGIINKLDHQI